MGLFKDKRDTLDKVFRIRKFFLMALPTVSLTIDKTSHRDLILPGFIRGV